MESPQAKPQHISDHLANERTILAWIRTSISVIALGVAINRFSLFLMEFYQDRAAGARRRTGTPRRSASASSSWASSSCAAPSGITCTSANSIDSQTYRAPRLVMALTVASPSWQVGGAISDPGCSEASPCGDAAGPAGWRSSSASDAPAS